MKRLRPHRVERDSQRRTHGQRRSKNNRESGSNKQQTSEQPAHNKLAYNTQQTTNTSALRTSWLCFIPGHANARLHKSVHTIATKNCILTAGTSAHSAARQFLVV